MLDKIKGALFGLAIGDAMGATTEFMEAWEIEHRYGRINTILGGGWLKLKPGEVTDDTAMTLGVARGIIKSPTNPIPYIGEEFLKWIATNPSDVGITIRIVLNHFQGDWEKAAYEAHLHFLDGKSAGNGTLMRCLPIALAYSDLEKMNEVTKLHSKMTHYDDQATEACLIYNRIANRILNNESLKESIQKEIDNTEYAFILNEEPNCVPDGYVVHTFRWALYWLLHCETFQDVITEATNRGGDSDTIAAIAGGLKGLEIGYQNLPANLVDMILCKEELDQVANDLLGIRE